MHCSCWLNLELIWSFFGPACVIIVVSKKIITETKKIFLKLTSVLFKKLISVAFQINVFFFLITVWKLVQKFSSLNPDLNNLQKIK